MLLIRIWLYCLFVEQLCTWCTLYLEKQSNKNNTDYHNKFFVLLLNVLFPITYFVCNGFYNTLAFVECIKSGLSSFSSNFKTSSVMFIHLSPNLFSCSSIMAFKPLITRQHLLSSSIYGRAWGQNESIHVVNIKSYKNNTWRHSFFNLEIFFNFKIIYMLNGKNGCICVFHQNLLYSCSVN